MTGGIKLFRRQFQMLLQESVTADHYVAVEMLLEHESIVRAREAEKNPHVYEQKYSVPLIKAAESGNCRMIKLFLKYHHTIPPLHKVNCSCDQCQFDKLGQTTIRLSTLKALSNPVWIALTSDNVFLTLFKLNQKNEILSRQDDSFEVDYENLVRNNEELCMKLLDEIRTQKCGNVLMRCKSIYTETECSGCDLSFINLAIEYCQKGVVAHPFVQHFLTSRVFDNIPGWRTGGIFYKVSFVALVATLWPVTTLLSILLPSKCCSQVANIAMNPFVKFINGAASFITFLFLLGVVGVCERTGVRIGKKPTGVDIAVFIWLIGFCVGEVKQLCKRGVSDYLRSGWNWVDIGMDLFMLFSIITWLLCSSESGKFYETMVYLADGSFSVAVILSFFRIIYLCQITSYLGLLQLCLGKMIKVILQTAFICIIVLLSFSVSMMFLYHASRYHNLRYNNGTRMHMFEKVSEGKSGIYHALTQNFDGFWATVHTMGWFSVGMKEINTLDAFADGTLIHLWANVLYIIYFGITMIVVLNMLIAMMNQSYQEIADNILTEHKYSRTSLWLEYVGDEQTRPVPFNLIPNSLTIKKFVSYLINMCNYTCIGKKKDDCESGIITLKKETNRQYKQLCDALIEKYIFKEYGFAINDQPLDNHGNVGRSDALLQKIHNYLELCTNRDEIIESSVDEFAYRADCLQQSFSDDGDVTPEWNEFLIL